MSIVLDIATIIDAQEIYDLQIKSFKALLEKYHDYDFNPDAEKLERTIQRLHEPITDYYFIFFEEKHIGALRICHFDKLCKLKQIFLLPEYQGYGYAQKAIVIAESLYQLPKNGKLTPYCKKKNSAICMKRWDIEKLVKSNVLKMEWILCFTQSEQQRVRHRNMNGRVLYS